MVKQKQDHKLKLPKAVHDANWRDDIDTVGIDIKKEMNKMSKREEIEMHYEMLTDEENYQSPAELSSSAKEKLDSMLVKIKAKRIKLSPVVFN